MPKKSVHLCVFGSLIAGLLLVGFYLPVYAGDCSDSDNTIGDLLPGTVLKIREQIDARDCEESDDVRGKIFQADSDGNGICIESWRKYIARFMGALISVGFSAKRSEEKSGLFLPGTCTMSELVGHPQGYELQIHDKFTINWEGETCPVFTTIHYPYGSGKMNAIKPECTIGEFKRLLGPKFLFVPKCKSR
jgi:hypothetical protein